MTQSRGTCPYLYLIMKDTIGRSGSPGLCTFRSLYSRGIFRAELRNRSYRGPGMAPVLKRERSRAFIRLFRSSVGSLVSLLYVLVSASKKICSDFPDFPDFPDSEKARPTHSHSRPTIHPYTLHLSETI